MIYIINFIFTNKDRDCIPKIENKINIVGNT